jgi:hypothetical protein
MALNRKLLDSYLNDHWAGSTAGRELAKRAAGSNRDNEFGALLDELLIEIDEDRATLRAVMTAVGVGEDRLKSTAARVAERAGRLKLNGSLFSYSPLSRLVELDGLALALEGKLSLWKSLEALGDPALSEFDFPSLQGRARSQLDRLEPRRLEAARIALRAT